MISTVWLFSAAILAVGPTFTKLTASAAMPAALANAGPLADLDTEIDAGLCVPALRLGIVKWRMVRGRRPVQYQIDGLGCVRGSSRRNKRERQSCNP